jgi:hypothetical protein
MWGTAIVFVAVLAAFVFFWLVFYKKETSDKPTQYSCHNCGEQHCDCSKDDASAK